MSPFQQRHADRRSRMLAERAVRGVVGRRRGRPVLREALPGGWLGYTAQELEKLTGVRVRTLRHWTHEKVLPRPLGYGRAARYTESHLLRAKVARHLRETRLPLRRIRDRIAKLSDEELRAMLPKEAPPTTPDGVPVPPPEPSYPATTWEVVSLMDGLVLLVNTARGPLPRRVASEIYRHYGAASR